MRILVGIISLILAFQAVGQIAFFKLYSNNGYDYGQGVVQLEDSSYVICGSSSSFTDGPADAFLLHIDPQGNYLWSNHYGGIESDWARRVMYKNNVGFSVAGYSNSFGDGAYDFYAFRTDLNGTLIWEKSYGGLGWERVHDAIMTQDTGMLIVGQSNSTLNGDNNMYIVRTAANGDTLWTKSWGGSGEDVAYAAVALTDTTYAIGGEMFVADSNQVKAYIMSIDDLGNILWSDTIPTVGASSVHDLDVDFLSNKLHFVGWKYNTIDSVENNLFGKYFLNGTFDFVDSEPTSDKKICEQITQFGSAGKNYLAYRYIDPTSFQDGSDIGISKLMSNLYWDGIVHSINYPSEDTPGQMIPTSDGGAMLVGSNSVMELGGGNVFAMKIGPNDLFPVVEDDPFPLPNTLVQVVELNQQEVLIYPIPTDGNLNIQTELNELVDIHLYDVNGQLVGNQRFFKNGQLDLSYLSSGYYFVKLHCLDSGAEKMIKVQKW